MTLIIGILCKDGVVIASDSMATFGKEGIPTIGQQEVRKVHKLADALLYSSMGAIGMSQVIADELKKSWEHKRVVPQ